MPADLRTPCYKAVLQDGDENTFEKMLKLYRSTDLHEEKDRISRALGSIKDVNILKKVIDFAMSVSKMKTELTSKSSIKKNVLFLYMLS